jgi:hypothetical protein
MIQERIKELLEEAGKPEEFMEELHSILEAESEEKRLKQIRRIIPDAYKIKVFGTKHSVLNIIGEEIGKFGEKNYQEALEIVRELWDSGSLEERNNRCQKFGKDWQS